jgi:sporulation protein YlmC with PRC-barrel domain
MKRANLASSVAACFCLTMAAPLLAAEPPAAGAVRQPPPPAGMKVSGTKPAEKCLNDLRALDIQMGKDGYWLGGSGYGYGYPIGAYGYENGAPMGVHPAAATAMGYQTARPGYEVRILVASAAILARHGEQQECENVLATSRDIYKIYAADLRSGKMPPMADVLGWRQQQVASAIPVTSKSTSFRSDELLGTDVRTPRDDALGSVEDLVMSPQTGEIAYLVVSWGGIFGFDEKYVPVPWADFKITPGESLLVLDTTTATMNAAPQVSKDQFTAAGHFEQESQKVDAYWKAHLTTITGSK